MILDPLMNPAAPATMQPTARPTMTEAFLRKRIKDLSEDDTDEGEKATPYEFW